MTVTFINTVHYRKKRTELHLLVIRKTPKSGGHKVFAKALRSIFTMRFTILASSIITAVSAFSPSSHVRHSSQLDAIKTKDIPSEGDRSLVEGPDGTIIVTKSGGKLYAVDAKCPHLGLPMKKGKIEAGPDGVPVITCNFHNSCFKMDSGKCTKWVTGALGQENGLIAGLMGKVGSSKTDVKAYSVKDNKDGSLTIT